MTEQKFNDIVQQQIQECLELLKAKGLDYADKEVDALSNFKTQADILKVSPLIVWAVYFNKHVISILKHVRGEELATEGVEGRIADAINYLILLRALIEESKTGKSGWSRLKEKFLDIYDPRPEETNIAQREMTPAELAGVIYEPEVSYIIPQPYTENIPQSLGPSYEDRDWETSP